MVAGFNCSARRLFVGSQSHFFLARLFFSLLSDATSTLRHQLKRIGPHLPSLPAGAGAVPLPRWPGGTMDSRVHNLAPGELFEVPIDIKAPSVLKFSFSVLEGGSVEFSVVHKAGGKKSKETMLLPASTYSENIGEVPASASQNPYACVRIPILAPRSKAPCLPLVRRSCCRARACASCASTTQPAGSTRPK